MKDQVTPRRAEVASGKHDGCFIRANGPGRGQGACKLYPAQRSSCAYQPENGSVNLMTAYAHTSNLIKNKSRDSDYFSLVDTSLIYEELKTQFNSKQNPIEVDFRSLVHWMKLGDQLTHQIHPYPAKLLPHIAHFFVRANILRSKGKRVLDPFCGSGTVALEASMAGFSTFVADANPFALLLTKVKTTPYSKGDLDEALKKIRRKAQSYKIAPEIPIVNPHLWFKPEHKRRLEIIAKAISTIQEESERDFFRIALSVTARKVSYADPAVSVPVRLKIKPKLGKLANEKIKSRLKWLEEVDVLDEFIRICENNISRVNETNQYYLSRRSATVVGTDARNLCEDKHAPGLKNKSIDLIITSPPYGSAQKYIRASTFALNWLQLASPKGLSELESRSIGREHLPTFRQTNEKQIKLPDKYEALLSRILKKNSLRANITRQYLLDMTAAAKEMVRVISDNGRIVIVVGNNQVCGEILRTDEFLVETFASLGFNPELSLIDHIKSRGLMTKRNRTASVISREAVIVFRREIRI